MAPTSRAMRATEIDHLIGNGDQFFVVAGAHDTRTRIGDASDRTGDQPRRRPIELRRRFVEHHERSVGAECAGHR